MHKLLIATAPSQLWRSGSGIPTKWTVIGPLSRGGTGPNGIDPNTVGYGNTVSTALADYERKTGTTLAGGAGLSATDLALIRWYDGIDASGGPTSVRRDRAGNYWGEYYRRSRGVHHHGPLPSMAAALSWLQAQGL